METDDPDDNHTNTDDSGERGWLVKENDSKRSSANGSDTGPYCIRCPDGKLLDRLREKDHTDDESEDGPKRGQRFREPIGVLKSDCPANFEQSRDE